MIGSCFVFRYVVVNGITNKAKLFFVVKQSHINQIYKAVDI